MIARVDIPLHDTLEQLRLVRRRLLFMVGVVVLLALCLVVRLVYLQLFQHGHYTSLSRDNRINLVAIPPARGLIYDRNGVLLARNVVAHNVEIYPDRTGDLARTLDELAQVVVLSAADVKRFHQARVREALGNRVVLRTGLGEQEVARFAVNRHRFPGVEIVSRPQRQYPLGELTAHVVGYVGRISRDDLASIDAARYHSMDYIGRLGLEARYEDRLFGRVGYEQVEINAHGRVVRSLRRNAPDAGAEVHLGFDAELQRAAMAALGERRGAVVAIEPATGDVLAFASTPSYDPNLFVGDIDSDTYKTISGSPQKPLLNRALHGRYSPGSTIKIVIGMAGLRNGFTRGTPVFCPGWYSLPDSTHRFRCWKETGHGRMTLHGAIVQSCDVYYYQLARHIGIERLSAFLGTFGLGRATGIDLDGESTGLLPSPAWKRQALNQPWHRGETLITGTGQGAMLMTPLQLAVMVATIANRGVAVQPRLVTGIGAPDGGGGGRALSPVTVPVESAAPADYEAVISAMTDVVHGPRGTARAIGADAPYRIAGKTGTTQVIGMAQGERPKQQDLEERFRDHALFIAFAPVQAPRIAVAVIVENGGSGSRAAAPVARAVMDNYLLRGAPGALARVKEE